MTRSGPRSKSTPNPADKPDISKIDVVSAIPVKKTINGLTSSAPSVRDNLSDHDSKIGRTIYPAMLMDPLSAPRSILAQTPGKDTHVFDSLLTVVPPEFSPASGSITGTMAPYFTAGIYDVPEWMFNDLQETRFVNYFGIEGAYHRGAFSIGSGAGISILQGKVENAVEYMDGIPKLDTANVTMRYTYLQIPVTFGYDFWQRGILKIGLRFGTAMSVLLDTKKLSHDYNPGDKLVTDSKRITPKEVIVNWQLAGGVNLSTELTEGVWFEITPMAKYYNHSYYEKPGSAKKPWSVGLRTALIFKL